MGPYDLAAVAFSEPDVKLLQPQASLPGHVAESIAQRIRQLGVPGRRPAQPAADLKVLENPGFQSKPSPSDPVPGWAVSKRPGVSITTDTTQGHEADPARGDPSRAQSVRISSDGPIACLVSQPFAPPAHGPDHDVGLAAGGRCLAPAQLAAGRGRQAWYGRDYYRYAVIGQPPGPGQEAKPIATTWGQYIVQFDDLPLDGLSQMRVRVDLMGAGEVWADDVQLFDLAFNESELRALYKLLTLADLNLQNGQVGDCLKLLNGYWPRFLMQNVPLPAGRARAGRETGRRAPCPTTSPPRRSPRVGWTA